MRIRVMSDLHIEFAAFDAPSAEADIVVLAGDILTEHYGLAWARQTFPNTPIVYVAGNHEHYNLDYENSMRKLLIHGEEYGVHVLEDRDVIIDGVRFLGATLWTDFEFQKPTTEPDGFALWYARRNMSDFRLIRHRDELFSPEASREIHLESRAWLTRKLAEPWAGKTVVVTHHLPHALSVAREFGNHPINPAFASHMPELVRAPVDLWVHGHTHSSCNYTVEGCRVLCNPRGYGPAEFNKQFDPRLVAEL